MTFSGRYKETSIVAINKLVYVYELLRSIMNELAMM